MLSTLQTRDHAMRFTANPATQEAITLVGKNLTAECAESAEKKGREGGILQPYSATDFVRLSGSLSLCALCVLCAEILACQGGTHPPGANSIEMTDL
jgi:hypothetical protein